MSHCTETVSRLEASTRTLHNSGMKHRKQNKRRRRRRRNNYFDRFGGAESSEAALFLLRGGFLFSFTWAAADFLIS